MQSRSDTWKELAATGSFLLNAVAVINGTEYTATTAPAISRGLFSDAPSIGNCTTASLSLSILTDDEIEKSAEVKITQKLLNSDGTESEGLPAGTFYISKRTKDYSSGLLTLQCYDAMLKAQEYYFIDGETDTTTWPCAMSKVVTIIAGRMGVEIDDRTEIKTGDAYVVTSPDGLTMMDVLGYIAVAHGGNWIITPEGKLRLVPLTTAPSDDAEDAVDVVAVLSKLTTGDQLVISKVTLSNAAGDSYTCGDDTGYEIAVSDYPCASQALCNDLYETLDGLVYNPFTMTKAIYDPAAELGDPVLYNGLVYGILVQENATLNVAFQATISAGSSNEIDDEYPYVSAQSKATSSLQSDVNSLKAASGMRATQALQEDGSMILYYYNGSTLAESNGVIRISDEGIQFTAAYTGDDSTTTWYGLDLSGDMLAKIISAAGLTLGGEDNGNGVLQVLDESGSVIATISNEGIQSSLLEKQITSTVAQTASSMMATIAATQDSWDTSDLDYSIDNTSYGTPDDVEYSAADYTGTYYLDQITGYVYYSDGTSWIYVEALDSVAAVVSTELAMTIETDENGVKYGVISANADYIRLEATKYVVTGENFWVDEEGNAYYAGELAANIVKAKNIDMTSLTADEAFINAISTNTVVAGNTEALQKAIIYENIYYTTTSSTTTAPSEDAEWSMECPEKTSGVYIWMKTVYTYMSGATDESSPVCISGLDGTDGADGEDGTDGTNGTNGTDGASVQIDSTEVTYQVSDSGTEEPTGSWSKSIPTLSQGKYLWTRTKVTYLLITSTSTSNETTTSYSVAYIGTDGSSGADGASVTIASSSVTYQTSTSGTDKPTGSWSTTIPSTTKGQYLWTRTVVTYTLTASDGTTSTQTTTSYSVAYMGTDGSDGADGNDGSDGQMLYATCNTAAGTAAKTATLSGGTLTSLAAGATVAVTFTYANTASSPRLNVAGTGAKYIHVYGSNLSSSSPYNWVAGSTIQFVYDGTYWTMTENSALYTMAQWCYNNDTTYINGGVLGAGTVTAAKLSVTELSAITADLGDITAGTLKSANYVAGSKGVFIDLTNGTGQFSGTIEASGGTIGGWTITTTSIYRSGDGAVCYLSGAGSSSDNFLAVTDTSGSAYFVVYQDGTMYCQEGIAQTQFRVSDRVLLFADDEGGNIDLKAPSNLNRGYQIDAYNGDLRIYSYTIDPWSYDGDIVISSTGELTVSGGVIYFTNGRINNAMNQKVYFYASSSEDEYGLLYGVQESGWRLCPATDAYLMLGSPSYRWGKIYSSSSSISTSDENEKDNIVDIDERYEQLFMKLRGVNYMWKNYDPDFPHVHDRIHCGLIAQEVEQACIEVGLDSMSFAALCKDTLEVPTCDGRTERYGLAYSELHGLEIHMIQKNVYRLDSAEEKIAELEAKVAAQDKIIEELRASA